MESLGILQNLYLFFLFILPFLLQHTEHLAREASKGFLQRWIMDTFGGYVALIPSISQHLPFQTVSMQEQWAAKRIILFIKTQKQL